MHGGDGYNELYGGKGNDDLYDYYGGDLLDGGPGNDIYHIVGGKSDTPDMLNIRVLIPQEPNSNPMTAQTTVPTGIAPTTTSVLGTMIVTFTAGDKMSFENSDASCPSGLTAGELDFDDVTISPPFIASVVGNLGMICEADPPNTC